MSKRNWQEAGFPSPLGSYSNAGAMGAGMGAAGGAGAGQPSPAQSNHSMHSHHSSVHALSPPKKPPTSFEEIRPAIPRPAHPPRSLSTSTNKNVNHAAAADNDSKLPGISRKVKACAACRKQKIKCIMVGDPPCQRCKERGLSCKLNKSLQTLMSEDSKWKSSVTKDVTSLYGSLERVLKLLNLPDLPNLHLATQDPAMFIETEGQSPGNGDDDDDTPDNSPKVTPITDNLSHVPIESLYQITGLRSLRATEVADEDQVRICKQLRDTDFIARGVIKVEDAEFLVAFYLKNLDPYIWHLASDYTDLDSLRSRSPTLTACILTVAALHDNQRGNLYATCSKEYRRLVANAMFERKIDLEYLRALVIGSYWLSDISWTLSGYAVRRASEFQFKQSYQVIADSIKTPGKVEQKKLQESMSDIRVFYLLYVCDHHLSVLYGRSSVMRDNESYVIGWENYLSCSAAIDVDRRIAGQVCLMHLMNRIRETLGPEDNTTILPSSSVDDLIRFESHLDDWIARFSRHKPHSLIGQWPSKGAIVHYHWAKLYLTSYAFRGLPDNEPIPEYFIDFASGAVSAATNIITLLLEDKDAHAAIGYVPHHVHGMIAFATMFLLKAATRYSEQLYIDKAHLSTLLAALAKQFKSTVVGKDHLLHRMAAGIEKMADMLDPHSRQRTPRNGVTDSKFAALPNGRSLMNTAEALSNVLNNQTNQNLTGFEHLDTLDFNDPSLGLGMPFFDFEGTTLEPGAAGMWNFNP